MSNANIKIVPEDFETAFYELMTLVASLDEYQSTLGNGYSAMQATWSGSAADAFYSYVPKLLADYSALTKKMKTVADDIKKVGDEMRVLDQQLADSM